MRLPYRFPRAVLFDLFHTLVLVRPDPATGGATWEDLGVPREAWDREFWLDRPGRAVGRVRDPVEGIRQIAHAIDPSIPLTRIERAVARRIERFERHLLEPEPAVVEALGRLRARGLRLALVSNAATDEVSAWPRSPLAAHFDAAVFSCEEGVAKPDARIYRAALERLGVRAKEAIFVGDGGNEEHRGARGVGLTTVLVTRLVAAVYPQGLPERRTHADHEFEDVPAFADRLLEALSGAP